MSSSPIPTFIEFFASKKNPYNNRYSLYITNTDDIEQILHKFDLYLDKINITSETDFTIIKNIYNYINFYSYNEKIDKSTGE